MNELFFLLTFLLLAFINSFVIIGVYEATGYELNERKKFLSPNEKGCDTFKYKMILWFVGYYGDKWLGKFWSKPFYSCCTCMASFWSLPVYFPFVYLMNGNLTTAICAYPIYILTLAGLSTWQANRIYK